VGYLTGVEYGSTTTREHPGGWKNPMIQAFAYHCRTWLDAADIVPKTQMVRAQVIRYVLVGLGLNAALYCMYLLLTWRIMGSEAAMTLTFVIGTLLSFLANRRITFNHRGDGLAALRRFAACYAFLYLVDFIALWVFAGQMRVPHQIVQGCVAVVLALLNFIVQRHWVFPAAAGTVGRIEARTT
jgi:putative flippase GtrA